MVKAQGGVERSGDGDRWNAQFARLWWQLGPESKETVVRLLPDYWSFEGKRVLDFGCGLGRTLRHFLDEAQVAEVWGADVDAASIEALEREFCPPLRALQCDTDPPLALEGGSFDLIWSISVFTHLTANSLPWLMELHRLLKPGGLLIATYMGRWHSEIIAGEPWDEDRIGMNVLRHNRTWGKGGPAVLMSEWWVREHWGRAFEILEIAPQIHHQSWALMRKRDVEVSVADLDRPGNDPREALAARHNVRQVQRELERAQGELDRAQTELERTRNERTAALERMRRDFEDSLSWRVTRPLRAATNAIRGRRSRSRAP